MAGRARSALLLAAAGAAGFAVLEAAALAPAGDLLRPRVWWALAVGWALLALPAWLAAVLLARLAARAGLPLPRAPELALGLLFVVAAAVHSLPALGLLPVALPAGARLPALLAAAAALFAALLRLGRRQGVGTAALPTRCIALLAAPVTLSAAAATREGAGAAVLLGVALFLALVAALVGSGRGGGRAVVAVLVASLALFRLATTNPHELHRAGPERGGGQRAEAAPVAAGGPVVLVVLDTFRADALDLAPPERSSTPALAALARRADVYGRAIANASWTVPGHASLFTALPVRRHRTDRTFPEVGFRPSLPATIPTAHELFERAGYHTVCVAANGLVGPDTGLSRGCREYLHPGRAWIWRTAPVRLLFLLGADDRPHTHSQLILELTGLDRHAGAGEVVDRALEALAGGGEGLYLFLNFMDAHRPYPAPPGAAPAERWRSRRDHLLYYAGRLPYERFVAQQIKPFRERYDARVRRLDRELGRLFDALRARGLFDRAAIVVTADHGEGFGENRERLTSYVGHTGAFEPVVRIPLLVKRPGQRQGRRIERYVQQVDVLPTLLDLAGLPPLAGAGPPLAEPHGDPIVTEWYPPPNDPHRLWLPVSRHALYRERFKLVLEGGDPPSLYDLAASPWEQTDVAGRHPELAAALARELRAALRREAGEPPAAAEPGSRLRDELQALGYLDP